MRIAIAILGFTLISVGWAQSQPPSPSPTISSQNEQAHAATPNDKTAENESKTAKPPVIVNVITAPQREHTAGNKTADSNDQSSGNGAIVPTWVVAIATVILTIATCILALYTWKLWGTTERSLVATFRPRITVRGVRLIDTSIDGPLKVEYLVVNIGGTGANIVASSVRAAYIEGVFPSKIISIDGGEPIPSKTFSSGQRERGEVQVSTPDKADYFTEELRRPRSSSKRLYFFGYIEYTDDVKMTRRTGFCRVRIPNVDIEFERIKNSEYEYED